MLFKYKLVVGKIVKTFNSYKNPLYKIPPYDATIFVKTEDLMSSDEDYIQNIPP